MKFVLTSIMVALAIVAALVAINAKHMPDGDRFWVSKISVFVIVVLSIISISILTTPLTDCAQ